MYKCANFELSQVDGGAARLRQYVKEAEFGGDDDNDALTASFVSMRAVRVFVLGKAFYHGSYAN